MSAAAQGTRGMHQVLDRFCGNQVPAGLCALGIMTKAPRAGAVKTRLQPPLTPEEAAALNSCFLRDTAAAIANAGLHTRGIGVFTPLGSEGDYTGILPSSFNLLPQRGDTFGQRLSHAIEDLLHVGFASCCLVDSDSPTVQAGVFQTAVELLRQNDDRVVLGPSDDGGYYLIGMRQLHRQLFEHVDWSTERVCAQTIERARERGLVVEMLPTSFDVDDGATLRRLCDELLRRDGINAAATRAFLEQLIAREGRERIWPR